MEVIASINIEVNNTKTPKHDEYVDRYSSDKEALQVLRARLINAATEFSLQGTTTRLDDFLAGVYFKVVKEDPPSWDDRVGWAVKDIVKNHFDQILEALLNEVDLYKLTDKWECFNDYRPSWLAPERAIELINDLNEHEEIDEGLWQNVAWDDALNIKARYTYSNALISETVEMLNEIQYTVDDLKTDSEDLEDQEYRTEIMGIINSIMNA
jgi:hypothetical protein